MRYHGNYCGNNWSDGKVQPSVVGTIEPIDEFDNTCRIHDNAYATGSDLNAADDLFVASNLLAGPKQSLAATAVAGQRAFRTIDNYISQPKTSKQYSMPKQNNKSKSTPNLRGTKPNSTSAVKQRNVTAASLTSIPAAYGYSLRMRKPTVSRNGNTAVITGSDFAGSVFASLSSTYSPASSVLLNPIYYMNGALGSLSRMYEKFRFKTAVVQYIPSVPTSTQGQVIMTSTSTVKEPFISGASSTFLSRALSQGNAVATPVWKEDSIAIECKSEWFIVDALIDADLDDAIQEEIQVYTICEAKVTCGILILHYEIEFKDPLFTYHPTVIPCSVGNGTIATFVDDSAVNAITDVVRIGGSGISLMGAGGIYRCVMIVSQSVLPTGPATWSVWARTFSSGAITTTTLSTGNATNLAVADGHVFYLLDVGGNFTVYASLDAAVAGNLNEAVGYQTATTAVGSYVFLVQAVRLGPALRVATQ